MRRSRRTARRATTATLLALALGVASAAPSQAVSRTVDDPADRDLSARFDLRRAYFDNDLDRLRLVAHLRGLARRGSVELTVRFDDGRGAPHVATVTRHRGGHVSTDHRWQPNAGDAYADCEADADARFWLRKDRVVLFVPFCGGVPHHDISLETSTPSGPPLDRLALARIGYS